MGMFECCKLINVEGRLCAIDAGIDRFNRGGLIELMVVCNDSILSIPSYSFSFDENYSAVLDGQIQLSVDAEVYRFRFTPETGGFAESYQETDDGSFFDQLISVSIPKDRSEITWLKYKMRNKRYAIIYKDQNGIVKLLENQRVKFDLDTKRKPAEYNGHVMTARRSSLIPSTHFTLTPGQTLEDIFLVSTLQFGFYQVAFPGGFAENQIIELPFTPVSDQATVVEWDQAVKMQLGTHYTVTQNKIRLKFSSGEVVDPTTIHIYYVYQDQGDNVAGFNGYIHSLSAAYTSGQTIVLPVTPLTDESVYCTFNDVVTLEQGTQYTMTEATVTLLFGGSPSPSDQDVFSFFYPIGGSPLTINGFKQYVFKTTSALSSGFIIELPHSPIASSLMAWFDESVRMREGFSYNVSGNEVEILFDVAATSADNPTVFDFWYCY